MSETKASDSTACDVCGSSDSRQLFTTTDRLALSDQVFSIVRCTGCNGLRTLPVMTEAELEPFYPDDYWGADDEPDERWIRRSQAEKVRFLKRCGIRGGRILDVGCGSGLFLRSLRGKEWERRGVETGKRAADAANKALGESSVFNGPLLGARFPDSTFDVVAFWSSLEHMNHPRENLVEARRIIRQGGTLIIQVPNAGSYQARVFGGQWFALDVPRHRNHFTAATLSRLLAKTGFEVYRASFFSASHNAHALRQSLKTRLRARESAAGYAAFCLCIPLIKPLDFLMSAARRGATLTVAGRAF